MSFQVDQACFDTALMAAQVSAAKSVGAIVVHGGTAYGVDVSSVSASVINYTFTPVGGGAALTLAQPYTALPCNLMTAADGLSVGWMVGAAWLSAWGLMFLTRALRDDTGGNYGNA